MSFLAKLFHRQPDPKTALVPLWNAVVAIARQPRWYADCKVADTPEGRFDMLTAVLAVVILRMERNDWLRGGSALLTELFVDDMEGQMRQQGIGDPTLGKRMGKLMSALGGRIGAYRTTLGNEAALTEAVERNMTFAEGGGTGDAACVARGLQALAHSLAACSDEAVLAGEFAR
jgi:cytochrome b pre-mRNA-processing protein 3